MASTTPKPAARAARKFRLRSDESVPDGLRRVARGQLATSAGALAGVGSSDELDAAAHSTRKAIKRVRATLRLSRDAIGEGVYQGENTQMKLTAGRLSGARDARVLTETLQAIEERFEDELPPFATAGLCARLVGTGSRALAG